jgi:hypothetical protein
MERLGLAWEDRSSGRLGGGEFSSISSTFLHGLALLTESTKQEAIWSILIKLA